MKVLIVGSGGREHAIAWKVKQARGVDKVYVAPGNAGTALEPGVLNINIKVDAIEALVAFAKKEGIGLTIIGPEAPLVDGIVDAFKKANLKCFGPVKAAAQLEGSKVFTKDFLKRHGIPTAEYLVFTELAPAKAYILSHKLPVVIKADGLAAGKGVIIAKTHDEAINAAKDMLSGTSFGEAGKKIIVEECIRGEEVSFIVIADGKNTISLATSQDHKAVYDGDQGPNTGGMGAYSPAPVLTDELYKRVMREVIQPTVKGMADEGTLYTGFLYAGLMILEDGTPSVLEYNCRLGDPETQPILMRLKSDLVELCMATIEGRLDKVTAEWDTRASLGVVMTAGGYPEKYNKGDVIVGLPEKEEADIKVFHAGTAMKDGKVVTSGGRVLCVTALGTTVKEAQKKAYNVVKKIKWENVYYRNDIGYRAVHREENRK
jgi:phosphoribosylamine---glycine ligase